MKEIQSIPLSRIKRAKVEVRVDRDQQALEQLAANVRMDGVTQPITVRPSGNGTYEIVAGHRRFDASKMAGKDTIPAIIEDVGDDDALVRAFTENELREDMTPLDKARAIRSIMQVKGWKIRDLENRGIVSHSSASELLLYLEEYETGVVPEHGEFSNPKDFGLAKTMVVRRAFLRRNLGSLTGMKKEVMDKVAKENLSIAESEVLANMVAEESMRVLKDNKKDVDTDSSDTMKAIFNTNAKDPAFGPIVRALTAVYRKRSGKHKREEKPNVVSQPMQDYIKALKDFGAATRRATRMAHGFSPESIHRIGAWHAETIDSLRELEDAIREQENER